MLQSVLPIRFSLIMWFALGMLLAYGLDRFLGYPVLWRLIAVLSMPVALLALSPNAEPAGYPVSAAPSSPTMSPLDLL